MPDSPSQKKYSKNNKQKKSLARNTVVLIFNENTINSQDS